MTFKVSDNWYGQIHTPRFICDNTAFL